MRAGDPMSRKLPLGRRHKNGTGNNKQVAARRQIVGKKAVAKKAKKNKPVQNVVLNLEEDEAAREARHRAECQDIIERGVQAAEDALLEHWCALPPTTLASTPNAPCTSPHARRPPGLSPVLMAASVVHCAGPRAARIWSQEMLLGAM